MSSTKSPYLKPRNKPRNKPFLNQSINEMGKCSYF